MKIKIKIKATVSQLTSIGIDLPEAQRLSFSVLEAVKRASGYAIPRLPAHVVPNYSWGATWYISMGHGWVEEVTEL